MGAVNYGFFFFLLSKILSFNCLQHNPPNSIPFHGQYAPAPNSWTGQPVLQGMTNIFDAMNPNPSQNTHVNINDNQQNIKYDQQYSTSQPYNSPYDYNQQYSMPKPYNAPPYNYKHQFSGPPTNNANTHNYEQQSSVIQPYNAPQVSQKNRNQYSKEPQLYNLYPPSQSSGQKNSQSFGMIEPLLKEYQKQLPSNINQPIEKLPHFDQPINNAKNQNTISQSSPLTSPIPNSSQSPQMSSNLLQPIVKETFTPNRYDFAIKEEVPDFDQPINDAKNQNTISQSSPLISPIPNSSQSPQMSSNLLQPIVKETFTHDRYDFAIKEEVPDFDQPINDAKNQNTISQSSPLISPIPNSSQSPQMSSNLLQPIVKETFTPNRYDFEIKEEVPDFDQPINNAKNQNTISQSSPLISPIPNSSQSPQMSSNLLQPIVKETFTPNRYDFAIKEEVPDFDQPINDAKNQNTISQSSPLISPIPNSSQSPQMSSNLLQPIVKETFTPNRYDFEIKEEVPDFDQPINNAKNQNTISQSSPLISPIPNSSQSPQMSSNLLQPIVKETFTPNRYDFAIKEEVPDFDQPINDAKNQNTISQSSPLISPIPNSSQSPQMSSNLLQPIVKETFTPNRYDFEIKEEVPDFDQPINNAKNQNTISQSSPLISPIPNSSQSPQMSSNLLQPIVKETFTPNRYDFEIKEEVPDFDQPINNAKNQNTISQSSPLISPIPNSSQSPQMSSNLLQPIVKETFTPNRYDFAIKEEVPDFDQPINDAKNQNTISQSSPLISPIPNSSQSPQMSSNLLQPIVKETFTPNRYDFEIKEEVPDFDQPINNAKNQNTISQSSPLISPIPNSSQSPQMSSNLLQPIVKETFTPNRYDFAIKEEVPDFDQPINDAKNQNTISQSSPLISPIPNSSQSPQMSSNLLQPIVKETFTPNRYDFEIKEEVPDFDQPINNAKNQNTISQSSPLISPIPNSSQSPQMSSNLLQPIVKETFTPNRYDFEIKEEVPDFDQPINDAKNQNTISQSSPLTSPIPNSSQSPQMSSNLLQPIVKETFIPDRYDFEIKEEVPDFGQPINNAKSQKNSENQGNIPSTAPTFPPNSNQLKLSHIPSQSSSKPFVKGSLTPNENTMQITNNNMSLNSFLDLPDGQSEPLFNDFEQNNDVLIDNSQTDKQSFLNSENNNILNPSNNVLENQYDSQLVFNDVPLQLPMNVQAANMIIDSQSNNLISYMDLSDDTGNLQNTLNKDSLPADLKYTELNKESKLKNAISESSVFALNDSDTENDKLYSLENLTFDAPSTELDRLSNYDSSYILDTGNPKNAKEDNAKITVYANPNDVHILQLSPKQTSTNDKNYLMNNNLLNTPSTGMPLWYSSFPNDDDYVLHFNSNINKQPSNSLFNLYQNPPYNQIPMYVKNSNYYNQQAAVDQNQMTSKTQSPGLSLDENQSNSMDNRGSIYKKVDLKNPPPNSSNSWSLLKKDYTKNLRPNQNDRYTSGDSTTRTSFFETPLSSYQNSNQGIINFPSNDMFAQNMISVISKSVQAPLEGTKAIFDVTNANFPLSSVNHIICLTHAIVQSIMLNLQQTLNTFMKTLYGRRVKRDFNPFEVLHNLPGALVNKYSLQSTAKPTTKNINSPYYNQPITAGQQPTVDYFISQHPTENIIRQQQTYNNEIDNNYYGSQNNNIGIVPQPASTQNYVLNSLINAIISAVRSNVPAPYSIDSPEAKQYIQQVIVTAEIVFKNQIDDILHGQLETLNMY